jgi:hypothetical protein
MPKQITNRFNPSWCMVNPNSKPAGKWLGGTAGEQNIFTCERSTHSTTDSRE